MHHKGNRAVHTAAGNAFAGRLSGLPGKWFRPFLNTLSFFFKSVSFILLKLKSLNMTHYEEAFIISIDNLSFGGTGKTALTIEIGKHLEQNDIKFAIVTRGYKSHFEKEGTTVETSHTVQDVGDEALLFKTRFPSQNVYVGKNRRKSIEAALHDNNHIILLDDGFQTTGIFKDFKIMLVNPLHPYYYLRNFRFLMKREDVVSYYRTSGDHSYDFELEDFYDAENRIVDIRGTGSSILGFSALGDNGRFECDLSAFALRGFIPFPDHHAYSEEEINELNRKRIQVKADYLVCTEKDFIKIKRYNLSQIPLIYVGNSIKFNFDFMGQILKNAVGKRK
jgi:tetraacyldisaccharide 4'-kinase